MWLGRCDVFLHLRCRRETVCVLILPVDESAPYLPCLGIDTYISTMKISVPLVFLLSQCAAFVPASHSSRSSSTGLRDGLGGPDLGLPCADECEIKYPNLPDSIHPGVLSGQSQLDLLNHAKENGE